MSYFKQITLASVASALMAYMAPAQAAPAWEFSSPGNSYTNGTWDFAQAFTVNTAVKASGLGYYADPFNGQVNSNPVALYQCATGACDTTGTLIASATVTDQYALLGHFRYVTIDPIMLMPGFSYEVAGVSSGDNYTWNDPGFTTNSVVSLVGANRWVLQGSPDFINFTQGDTTDGYWGPNVFLGDAGGFTNPVPLPNSLPLFGGALLVLGAGGVKLRNSKRSSLKA